MRTQYWADGDSWTLPAGIACIALTFVDEHGSPTSLPHGEKPDPLKLPSSSPIMGLLQDTDFESLTAVSRHQPEPGTPHSGREQNTPRAANTLLPPHPVGHLGRLVKVGLQSRAGLPFPHRALRAGAPGYLGERQH